MENKETYEKLLDLKVSQIKNASSFMEADLISRSLINLIHSYVEDCEWCSSQK